MIGFAAAAAEEESFHAKAAKEVFGAKKGLFLVKNASRVANIMGDVVGDICGILSGSLGTIIVIIIAIISVSYTHMSLPKTHSV